jgi:hypothetical protein
MTLIFTLLLLLAGGGPSAWAESSPTTAGSEIKGDVLYWEGEELVVREMSGHEVRIRVTSDTKIQGASGKLKTGDKIAATVGPNGGPATSITLQIPDSGSPVPPVR